MAQNHRNRTKKSNSVLVGVIAFLLGFLFALIVLFGSIFGIGYVVATTDINKVLSVFGLENVNGEYDENDPDSDKYNYINADQAPNLYKLVTEIIAMANDGLGEINLDRIDALAPITDTVLDYGYKFIDGVVDFDKPYFEGVPLTSIIDCVKNSMFYVHTGKITQTLNSEAGTEIDLSEVPIAGFMIDGIETEYASVSGKGEDFRLPVFFDYYINDGSAIGYGRTVAVDGVAAYPDNLKDDLAYIQETTLTNEDGNKLYRVHYVPCKVTPTGIEEAEYITKKITVEDPNVTFTKDGETVKLKYVFTVLEYGADTDFIAVKPNDEDGVEKFSLDFNAIMDSKNSNPNADASNRYVGYSYYEAYARNYYEGPSEREENEMIYGVKTINHINFFHDNAGNVVEYDPLLVADLMIDVMETLNHVPVWNVVNASQGKMVRDIFGDTSLGDVLNQNVNFNELIDGLKISSFINNVDPDDKVMSFLVYNLTDVKKGADGTYTATYDKNGDKIPVTVKVEGGKIVSVKDASGKTLKGNTVADISNITNDLTLDVFMDVKADDPIMMYLGYGVSDVYEVKGQDYAYVGMDENNRPVHIFVNEDGTVDKIETESGMVLSGTDINGVSDRVNGITDVLALPDFIDVDPEESILSYIGYGIYDVEANAGINGDKDYQYTATYDKNGTPVTAYIATETKAGKTKITSVWTDDGNVSGTKINDVSDRLDTITDVLTIDEFMDIKPSDSIMAYMGYGVNKCTAQTGTDSLGNAYDYTAKYTPAGATEPVDCYIKTNADGFAESAWYIEGGVKKTVKGTKIGAVPDRISDLQNTLTIGELIEVTDESSMILKAIQDTTIGGLDERIDTLTVSDVLDDTQIKESSVLSQLKHAHITELGTKIDEVLIQRIYSKEIYGIDGDPIKADTFNSEYLYYEKDADNGFALTKIGCTEGMDETAYDNALGKLTQEQWEKAVSEGKDFYTYGEAKGMWKLILYRTLDDKTKTEKAYTINNFNNMVNSCTTTVYNSTLGELRAAGIISVEESSLDKKIKVVTSNGNIPVLGYVKIENGAINSTTVEAEATSMKDLTLKQLVDAIILFNN